MKTIVVGYNESEASERALARAGELAALYSAELVVTSVVPFAIIEPGSAPSIDDGVAGRLAEKGIEADVVSGIGDPSEVIVSIAEQRQADLIVVGTREPSLIERNLGHSVSEQVQRRAHCDVLIVH
jgi:nucleotide-binding universal stress UspA family protein